ETTTIKDVTRKSMLTATLATRTHLQCARAHCVVGGAGFLRPHRPHLFQTMRTNSSELLERQGLAAIDPRNGPNRAAPPNYPCTHFALARIFQSPACVEVP